MIKIKELMADLLNKKEKLIWECPMLQDNPCNFVSNHEFQGFNRWFLNVLNEWDAVQFCTFMQAKTIGAKVKKGAKTIPLLMPIFKKKKDDDDEEEDSAPMFYKKYNVFNIRQLDNVPNKIELKLKKLKHEKNLTGNQVERFNSFTKLLGVRLRTAPLNRNVLGAYFPATHHIDICPKEAFKTEKHYCKILLHEITHWSSKKMKRPMNGKKDEVQYMKEEIIAEMGSALLCEKFDIGYTTTHKAYIQRYWKRLKEDKNLLFDCWSKANKAVKWLSKKGGLDEGKKAAKKELATLRVVS